MGERLARVGLGLRGEGDGRGRLGDLPLDRLRGGRAVGPLVVAVERGRGLVRPGVGGRGAPRERVAGAGGDARVGLAIVGGVGGLRHRHGRAGDAPLDRLRGRGAVRPLMVAVGRGGRLVRPGVGRRGGAGERVARAGRDARVGLAVVGGVGGLGHCHGRAGDAPLDGLRCGGAVGPLVVGVGCGRRLVRAGVGRRGRAGERVAGAGRDARVGLAVVGGVGGLGHCHGRAGDAPLDGLRCGGAVGPLVVGVGCGRRLVRAGVGRRRRAGERVAGARRDARVGLAVVGGVCCLGHGDRRAGDGEAARGSPLVGPYAGNDDARSACVLVVLVLNAVVLVPDELLAAKRDRDLRLDILAGVGSIGHTHVSVGDADDSTAIHRRMHRPVIVSRAIEQVLDEVDAHVVHVLANGVVLVLSERAAAEDKAPHEVTKVGDRVKDGKGPRALVVALRIPRNRVVELRDRLGDAGPNAEPLLGSHAAVVVALASRRDVVVAHLGRRATELVVVLVEVHQLVVGALGEGRVVVPVLVAVVDADALGRNGRPGVLDVARALPAELPVPAAEADPVLDDEIALVRLAGVAPAFDVARGDVVGARVARFADLGVDALPFLVPPGRVVDQLVVGALGEGRVVVPVLVAVVDADALGRNGRPGVLDVARALPAELPVPAAEVVRVVVALRCQDWRLGLVGFIVLLVDTQVFVGLRGGVAIIDGFDLEYVLLLLRVLFLRRRLVLDEHLLGLRLLNRLGERWRGNHPEHHARRDEEAQPPSPSRTHPYHSPFRLRATRDAANRHCLFEQFAPRREVGAGNAPLCPLHRVVEPFSQ